MSESPRNSAFGWWNERCCMPRTNDDEVAITFNLGANECGMQGLGRVDDLFVGVGARHCGEAELDLEDDEHPVFNPHEEMTSDWRAEQVHADTDSPRVPQPKSVPAASLAARAQSNLHTGSAGAAESLA